MQAVWVLACLALVPGRAFAQSARHAVVIEGASGGEEYAVQHRGWLDGMVKILRDKFAYDPAHLTVLAETPGPGEARATAENVRGVFTKLASALKPQDLLFVMLIGHGAGEGAEAKFSLVGRSLSVGEWNSLLKPIQARVVFVDATSSSFSYLAGLAAPERVIITATNSQAQHYHTVFAEAFIQAFSTDAADLDKNGRISLWEAFVYASRQVKQHYDQSPYLATEHAVLDDTGTGAGRDATATGQGSTLAGLTYLDALPETRATDPDVQALIQRRDALTEQVDDLRRHRQMMSSADFDQAFEKLIIELATVSHEIRRRAGG
jgi:hypothetical protein